MKRLHLNEEAERCLLCENAPCTAACKHLSAGVSAKETSDNGKDPARALRAIRFDNAANSWKWFKDASDEELEAAENACIHYDRPIRIREIAKIIGNQFSGIAKNTDHNLQGENDVNVADRKIAAASDKGNNRRNPEPSLEIDFCGLRCENPFFLASSAICTNYEMVASALEAGWAGVYYKTICLEDINEVSPRFDVVKNPDGSFAGFRNMEQLSENPPYVDFDILKALKRNYPSKIIVASIMGAAEQEWIDLAKMAEEAGVDAVELNFSCPQMKIAGMGSDVGQNAEMVAFLTAYVKNAVKIPVIPKMTPNVASMTKYAMSAHFAGADGISAINTIKSITMSADSEVSGKKIVSGYSGKAVKPIALRFILEMSQNKIVKNLQISGIGGITTWRDALEFIQLGCRNTQVCTAVMEYGYRIIDDLTEGLKTYMARRGVARLEDIVGEELDKFVRTSDLDRDTKVFPTINREVCIGCGRCYISCRDGGHQAISFSDERQPRIIGTKCVGCHLCRLVCPTSAIGISKRIQK